MDEDVAYDGLVGSSRLNSQELVYHMDKHSKIEDFLSNEDLVFSFHASKVTDLEKDVVLDISFDIDGLVVQLNSLSSIVSPIYYLKFDAEKRTFYNDAYHLIKKHLVLSKYKACFLKFLKRSQCVNVAYFQGFRASLGIIPENDLNGYNFESAEQAKKTFYNYLSRLQRNFVELLQNVSGCDARRPTIRKNSLFDISNMNVLPADQNFILSLLDRAIAETVPEVGTKVMIFVSKFGQKDHDAVTLTDLFVVDDIIDISVHSACNLSAEHMQMHLLWSRQALYQVSGTLGRFFGCLGIREAANYQSNLDSRAMTIHPDLRSIAVYPQCMTFIQLYADSPHTHPDVKCANPISGLIASCGLLHHNTSKYLSNRADEYLKTFEDNSTKLSYMIPCRLETVTKLVAGNIPSVIDPKDFFHEDNISRMLNKYSLIVPFSENVLGDGDFFVKRMQLIAKTLCRNLKDLYRNNVLCGTYTSTWASFQMELALENFFYGKSQVDSNEIFATNLGPGQTHERSLTLRRGFLGLEPSNSSSSPEVPPPTSLWTKNEKQRERIYRLFGFFDNVEASNVEVGCRLVRIVILDLFDTCTFPIHTLQLNKVPPGCNVKGGITPEQLADELSHKRKFRYPYTFGRALELLEQSHRTTEAKDVIVEGLVELKLKHFPAFKTIDVSRNAKINWNKKDYWQILNPGNSLSIEAMAGEIHSAVLVELVNKRLTYASNLDKFRECMPWILPILKRLKEQSLSRSQLITVCTFLSAVALLQQQVYVDYNALSNLELTLPLKQSKFRLLQIQGNRLVSSKLNRVRVWVLHESIGIKILSRPVMGVCKKSQSSKLQNDFEEPPEEALIEVEDEETENRVEINPLEIRTVPSDRESRWLPQELAICNIIIEENHSNSRKAYETYVKRCWESKIPSRTFQAFRRKLSRLKSCIKTS